MTNTALHRLYRAHQMGALTALAVFSVVVALIPGVPDWAVWAVCAVAIALIGLPHGALDAPLGMVVGRELAGWRGVIAFLAGYTALALAFIALVAVAAWLALAVLLTLAAIHFGEEDVEARGGEDHFVHRVSAGMTAFAAPWLFQPERTLELFSLLVPEPQMTIVAAARWPVAAAWLVATALSVMVYALAAFRKDQAALRALIEIPLITAVFGLLDPLIAFTLYFCLVHAPRHVMTVAGARNPERPDRELTSLAWLSMPPTLATLAGVGLAGWWLMAAGWSFERQAAALIFWTLAALTPPHMLLFWYMKRRGSLGPAARRARMRLMPRFVRSAE